MSLVYRVFIFFLLSMRVDSVFASGLLNPFDLESTQVLPQGIGNPRFKSVWMELTNEYGRTGELQPVGQPLNQRVDWAQLSEQVDDHVLRNLFDGVIGVYGMEEESPGDTTGQVNAFVNVQAPVLAFGLTENFTIGLALPIYNVDVQVATGFVASPVQMQDFLQKVRDTASPVMAETAASELARLDDAVNELLTGMGYEEVRSEKISGLGDAMLVGKYRFWNDRHDALSVSTTLTLPTGIAPNVDKALDVPTGDGQWDIGFGAAYDRHLLKNLDWNLFTGYTIQFSDRLARRLPENTETFLSKDKEVVNRDLGDQFKLGTSFAYRFEGTGFSIGAGYQYQFQFQTTFDGTQFEPNRYRLLEYFNPAQSLHSGIVKASFSTIKFFQQQKFVYPFEATLAYSRALAGLNARTSDILAAELVLFF